MGATSIQDAKVLISSTKVADRNAGLKDLIHILKHNRGKSTLEVLSNKAYLALCETLLQVMHDERSSWLRSSRPSTKASSLLALSANALRQVVYSGVRTIKTSTVEMIVDTIVELLPGKDGAMIKPLVEDLPKTLRALLEHQPHVERVSKECWEATVEFCVQALSRIFAEVDAEPQNSWSTTISSLGPTPFESTDGGRRDSPSKRGKQLPQELVRAAEELVHCLHLLVKASNSPVLDKAEVVLMSTVYFLQQNGGRGKAAALAAINSILPRITLHATQLTEQVVQELIPLMKSMWSDPLLREEIMITLIYTEAHIASMLVSSRDDSFSFQLEALVETMYSDYRRRQDTTAHQYLEDDHLCFRGLGSTEKGSHPLATCAFSTKTDQVRYEGLWATIATIARFSYLLDERKHKLTQGREGGEDSMIKRPRVTHHFQEYLRHVSEPRSNAKRAALQVVTFMAEEGRLDEEDLLSLLERLTPCISDENPAHSSWAMIGLATAAFHEASKATSLSTYWTSAWNTASRAMTTPSSSRAACHFMDVLLKLNVVPYTTVSDTVQSMMMSIELSGPALLTETSAALMTTLIRERINENPTHYNITAERVLNWLFSKWTPSLWSERTYAALNAHNCNARDLLRILHACLDRPFECIDVSQYQVLGPIAQARMQAVTYKDLSHYLLLLDNNEESKLRMVSLPSFSGTAPSDHANQLQSRVLDFCISEVDKAKQRWKESLHQNPQGVTPDMLRVLTNLCVAAASIATMTDGERNDHRVSTLKSAADELAQSFVKLVSKSQTEQYKVDAILASCAQILPDIRRIPHLRREIFQKEGLMFISTHLSRALEERMDAKQSFHAEEDDFMMDIDDGPTSQMTVGASGSDVEVPRHDIQASAESGALHVCCSTFLRLISSVGDMTEDEQDYIPSEFVEYLATMSEADLLRSRQLVQSLLGSRFKISRTDCLKLLERLSDALIDPKAREYNTSEVANGMVVDVLIGTTRVWTVDTTDREAQDLYENVEALYAYYAKGLEKSGVRRSPGLQMRVAKFFHGLLRHHPGFGQNRKVPSVRTSLFELLSQGEMTVKYHIAERLPGIFEDFVLSEHDKILEDVDSSLPSEDDWFEGIAVRLLVLANLASRWHTLLRQCVYRLFATAGSIKGVAQHARRCISQVAESRNMADSQSLFRLFAPQIVYTWLDRERKLAEMPYSTFGYETLEDFLRDMESEGVGQAIMRGLQDEVNYLAVQLGISVTDLLIRNMSKAAAYTISWDTCRGYGRNKSMPSTCSLLRDLVGKDQYHQLIYAHFSEVLGHILQTIDQEDKFSKQLSKRPAFASTEKALSEMEGISRSTLDLNIGIEPAFSAYYLFDQIDRLCRRADADTLRFWEPSTYTMVIRMLLDRMHPALGSLYARSLIRKIRIVVALAGPVAYEGYPLQMTLQSLRPFLTDVQCAEDTVGIMQYLFSHGTPFLTSDLNFVTGIGLSVLISIRVFLGSSQESTTQQSQHTATMNTATRFHKWFTNYLTTYADGLSVNESQSSIKAFKLITMAASHVRTEGNSMRGSEESKLLLEILDDVRSGRRLLNNTSREVALDLLCQNFQPAPTARDDVLGSDDQASEFASQVWESCQRNNVGNGYLLWAARVLGRAFGARGHVTRNTANLNPWSAQMLGIEDRPGRASRSAIVKEVVDLFYSDDRGEVSLAENAIRLVIANLPNASGSYAAEMGAIIPEHVGRALGSSISSEESSSLQGRPTIQQCAALTDSKPVVDWIRDLAISLCREAYQDPVLGALPTLLAGINHMAEKLFPFILHLVLLREFDGTRTVHQVMSTATMTWFSKRCSTRVPYMRILVQSILYLRSQPVPKEVTRVDRERWLELDYLTASEAATECGMYRSALLFAETSSGQPKVKSVSRRSSVMFEPPKLPVDLQLSIYKNLDEPDSFYGVDRGFGLASVIDRLDYEGDGVKSLLFRGARLDSQFRRTNALEPADSRGMVKSLIALNMNSVTHSLLSNDQFREMGSEVVENTLRTARKLGQWDMKAPDTNHTEASTLFKAFQGLHYATSITAAKESLDSQFLATMGFLSGKSDSPISNKTRLRTLATLTEADDVISVGHPSHLLDTWDGLKGRESWMRAGEFEDVRQLLSCRETLFKLLSTNEPLLEALRVRTGQVRSMETEALMLSSAISRKHGALQESLASVTYLSDLVPECRTIGLDIEASAQNEVASVLWEQGEAETSIRMRQHLIEHANLDSQDTSVSLPVLLAKLGHHLAEARLAKPDSIIHEYLEPAIRELKGQVQGPGPGQVFHEFALFCDKQLQNPEAAEDMQRIKSVMDKKYQEYKSLLKDAQEEKKSKTMRDSYRNAANKAKKWYDLDHTEYERLRKGREQFLRQCLENYLLSLQASDEYNHDALRVFSLWLENSDMPLANAAVKLYLDRVPSGKFALLMNQLSSRLQAEEGDFQKLLRNLVFRICLEHPYHGMHQIFAIQMKVGNFTRDDVVRSKDEAAKSRQKAAGAIADALGRDSRSRPIWNVLYRSNQIYHALAMFKDQADNKQGREIRLDKYPESRELKEKVPALNVPPATLQIEVRADCKYGDLPTIRSWKPTMSIANGLSAPKVISAIGSDGKQYKQLYKSGNDDLRQDAIMEQVFDQVSRLLKNHTATRLRNLGIRTYKVLPLSTRSGLMEFVQDTVPLHVWVMPAHERYYPSDYKPDECRKRIGNAQQDVLKERVKVWRKCADNFHPVLRYFLLEHFQDPDEWFERRLAYTRSTAAISILGHVLGLGDRHCHNILLDKKSGEVIHIDLGVSFEAGRVLPVPEVVPFRLTRDLVDAMGYTKTEGVFRRCCEFTMDTLREERESIMTLLNVLRYDPLVNWSVTPTKAKRMQEGQDTNAANGGRAGTVGPGGTPAPSAPAVVAPEVHESNKKREEQAGEAGRALSVVEKKLSKTLSTKATVNELIQTATDEKNLAVLYMGWASYA